MELAEKPLVSVICNAYNHELYIRDALEGFVTQKTDFPFEILIHDDASTDKTADIIREYEARYPELIKPIYQTENQYSRGGIRKFQFPRATGKYIAFCEGDDYWTDPLKLQKQVNALEAHPEVDICAHAAFGIHSKTGENIRDIAPDGKDGVLTAAQVIAGGGGFVATNSLMYRREILDREPPFRQFLRLDYTIQIFGSLRGGMLYLADHMSVYRIQSVGSWSSGISKDHSRYIAHLEKLIQMLQLLDADTEGRYGEVIASLIREHEFHILTLKESYGEMLSRRYKAEYRKLSRKERAKVRLKAYFPWLLQLVRRSKQR